VFVGKTKVSWSIDEAVVRAVTVRAASDGRSVSSAAERLLSRALNGGGLGGEEPNGGSGGSRVAVDPVSGSPGLSSPPSSSIDRDGGRSGGDKGADDVSRPRPPAGLSSGPRHDSHFKPDPKPGRGK